MAVRSFYTLGRSGRLDDYHSESAGNRTPVVQAVLSYCNEMGHNYLLEIEGGGGDDPYTVVIIKNSTVQEKIK